jgi:hypothetical protein
MNFASSKLAAVTFTSTSPYVINYERLKTRIGVLLEVDCQTLGYVSFGGQYRPCFLTSACETIAY